MKITLSTKGRIVLPAELCSRDSIEPGQVFEIERLGPGEYRLVRLALPRNSGILDWLLACPEKGYFVSIKSESTDTTEFTSPLTPANRNNSSNSS